MPIAAVPGEPRGVKAQNGADLAGAQPGNQLVESRSGNDAARRATEVIIDDFDIAKSTAASLINQLILTSLALEVGLAPGPALTDERRRRPCV
jgi:hypothetical protein